MSLRPFFGALYREKECESHMNDDFIRRINIFKQFWALNQIIVKAIIFPVLNPMRFHVERTDSYFFFEKFRICIKKGKKKAKKILGLCSI